MRNNVIITVDSYLNIYKQKRMQVQYKHNQKITRHYSITVVFVRKWLLCHIVIHPNSTYLMRILYFEWTFQFTYEIENILHVSIDLKSTKKKIVFWTEIIIKSKRISIKHLRDGVTPSYYNIIILMVPSHYKCDTYSS